MPCTIMHCSHCANALSHGPGIAGEHDVFHHEQLQRDDRRGAFCQAVHPKHPQLPKQLSIFVVVCSELSNE